MKVEITHPVQSSFWNLRSITELEVAAAEDYESDMTSEELNQRDKEVGREIRSTIKRGTLAKNERGHILAMWLESRRSDKKHKPIFETVEAIVSTVRMFTLILAALFFALFIAYAWSMLNMNFVKDSDAVVVHIAWFFTVGIPFLATFVAVIIFVASVRSKRSVSHSPIRELLAKILSFWIPPPDSAEAKTVVWKSLMRLLKGGRTVLGTHLGFLVSFIGLAGVLGIWVAISLFDRFEDQQYGWKSHRDDAAETVVRQVSFLATPWSGIAPVGEGFPTPEQVRASQIPINPEYAEVARAARKPWIQFLGWSALIYGVLPRLGLFLFSYGMARHSLRCRNFEGEPFDSLHRRLTEASGIWDEEDGGDSTSSPPTTPEEHGHVINPIAKGALVLVTQANLPEVAVSHIEKSITKNHGHRICHTEKLTALPHEQKEVINKLLSNPTFKIDSAVLVQTASQPPIDGFSDLIKNLNLEFGDHRPIHVFLTGDLDDDETFDAVTDDNHQVWSRFIGQIPRIKPSCEILNLDPE